MVKRISLEAKSNRGRKDGVTMTKSEIKKEIERIEFYMQNLFFMTVPPKYRDAQIERYNAKLARLRVSLERKVKNGLQSKMA